MFTLAHLSDPHLAPLPTPRFSELASKRLLGFLNWQRKRRDIHQRVPLDEIVADLATQTPDHTAVTGDLVNIALPDEFAAARAWLAALGSGHNVTVIPGNHDAYVRSMIGQAASSLGRLHVRRRGRGAANAVRATARRRCPDRRLDRDCFAPAHGHGSAGNATNGPTGRASGAARRRAFVSRGVDPSSARKRAAPSPRAAA